MTDGRRARIPPVRRFDHVLRNRTHLVHKMQRSRSRSIFPRWAAASPGGFCSRESRSASGSVPIKSEEGIHRPSRRPGNPSVGRTEASSRTPRGLPGRAETAFRSPSPPGRPSRRKARAWPAGDVHHAHPAGAFGARPDDYRNGEGNARALTALRMAGRRGSRKAPSIVILPWRHASNFVENFLISPGGQGGRISKRAERPAGHRLGRGHRSSPPAGASHLFSSPRSAGSTDDQPAGCALPQDSWA